MRQQTANRSLVILDRDALRFEQRHSIGKQRNIRRRATDIDRNGIHIIRNVRQHTHDRCGRAGQNGLDRRFAGLFEFDRTTVGFQNVKRNIHAQLVHIGFQLVCELVLKVPDSFIQIRRRNATREIQRTGQLVAL